MMRFLVIFAVAMTSVTVKAEGKIDRSGSLPAPSRASLDGRVPSLIPLGVLAPGDVTESLLIQVFDEANAIWGPAGIVLDWHRITSKEADADGRVTVEIEDDRRDFGGRRRALGSIPFTAKGPAPSIHLSLSAAEAMIRETPVVIDATIGMHETLMGRALGRALSHELGHYLLKSKGHTRQGLMRATWPSAELLSIDRRGFELTAEERAAAERANQPIEPSPRHGLRFTGSAFCRGCTNAGIPHAVGDDVCDYRHKSAIVPSGIGSDCAQRDLPRGGGTRVLSGVS